MLVVDSAEGATDQDATIAGEAEKAGCGIIIAANKWDLMKGRGTNFSKDVRRQAAAADEVPGLRADSPHLGADRRADAEGARDDRQGRGGARCGGSRPAELNRFVQTVTAVHPPASPGRRQVRILYAAQTGVAPPTFVLFTNVATEFHFSYERFLINQLRESFGFVGTPIRLHVRRRQK